MSLLQLLAKTNIGNKNRVTCPSDSRMIKFQIKSNLSQ